MTVAAQDPTGVSAEQPTVIENEYALGISPDGKYLVTSLNEGASMRVHDLTNGTSLLFEGTDYDVQYSIGLGNAFSDNGIIVGSRTYNGTASYIENGEWHDLSVLDPEKVNLAHGISPDGEMICGNIGLNDDPTQETSVMCAPAIWTRQADGTYSEPTILPYPTLDFTGRVCQYVTALTVAADKKHVFGMITDYSGGCILPILYVCNDQGEWNYVEFAKQYANPNNVEIPEYPAEVQAVEAEDFMSEEEKAAYQEAYDAWVAEGTWDYSTMPEMENYMSEEHKAAYDAAYAAYLESIVTFNQQFDAFYAAFEQVMADGRFFVFNNLLMTPDGKKIALSADKYVNDPNADPDAYFPEQIHYVTPTVFTFDDNYDHVLFDGYTGGNVINVSGLNPEGALVGFCQDENTGFVDAKICPAGETEFVALHDHVAAKDADVRNWMTENMVHDVIVDYDEDYNPVYSSMLVSGVPFATADHSTFAVAAWNGWDFESENPPASFTYLFKVNEDSGIGSAVADAAEGVSVEALKGGVVKVSLPADLAVYNVQGQLVFEAAGVCGDVATGLGEGIYVVKATAASGTVTVKVVF